MENLKLLLLSMGWFLIAQTAAWYQTNSQFISSFLRDNKFLTIIIFALPIGYAYIEATRLCVEAFKGVLWPTRLIGFAMGIISFTILTYFHLNEPLTYKTIITLFLALLIVLIQIFLK